MHKLWYRHDRITLIKQSSYSSCCCRHYYCSYYLWISLNWIIFPEITPGPLRITQKRTFEIAGVRFFTGQMPSWKKNYSVKAISLSILTAIFPGEPGLVLLKLRIKKTVLTTGAVNGAKLQSNCHRQQTTNQLFTGRMSFLSPSQHKDDKVQCTMTRLTCCMLLARWTSQQSRRRSSSQMQP